MGKSAFRVGLAAWAAGVMISCGGSSGAGPAQCDTVEGLYSYVFTNTWTNDATNCPVPSNVEAVVSPTNPASYPAGCSVVSSGTSCSASLQITCPDSVDGFAGQSVRILTGDTDAAGDKITGSVQAEVLWDNGQGQCNASWDFTATRVHQ